MKSRTPRLLNSVITARTPNTFSVFLFDYNISAVPYKRFVNNSVQAVTPNCTSRSNYIISSEYLRLCIVMHSFSCWFHVISARQPSSNSATDSRYWALATSTFQRKKLLKIKWIYIYIHIILSPDPWKLLPAFKYRNLITEYSMELTGFSFK
jgi:hypothetical protein